MKTNKLILVAFVLMSNLTFSQANIEEFSFWNQPIVGLRMYEVIIAIVAILGIVYVAYASSVVKTK